MSGKAAAGAAEPAPAGRLRQTEKRQQSAACRGPADTASVMRLTPGQKVVDVGAAKSTCNNKVAVSG